LSGVCRSMASHSSSRSLLMKPLSPINRPVIRPNQFRTAHRRSPASVRRRRSHRAERHGRGSRNKAAACWRKTPGDLVLALEDRAASTIHADADGKAVGQVDVGGGRAIARRPLASRPSRRRRFRLSARPASTLRDRYGVRGPPRRPTLQVGGRGVALAGSVGVVQTVTDTMKKSQ
jgi:hypothetical protein